MDVLVKLEVKIGLGDVGGFDILGGKVSARV